MPIEPSDEMTSSIVESIEGMLGVMRELVPFTNGDVMSAALHVLVDAGMRGVESGTCTRQQLIKDIIAAVPQAVMDYEGVAESVGTMQ